jgi:hypothetical protein
MEMGGEIHSDAALWSPFPVIVASTFREST